MALKTDRHERAVEAVEDYLDDSPARFQAEVRETVAQETVAYAESGVQVKLFAQITSGDRKDIKRVGDFTGAELYAYSDSSAVYLARCTRELHQQGVHVLAVWQDETERELQAIALRRGMHEMLKYTGVSAEFDELICGLQVCSAPLSLWTERGHVKAIVAALAVIADRLRITDAMLDEVWDVLESAGFDVDVPVDLGMVDDSQSLS